MDKTLLDTNILSELLKGKNRQVIDNEFKNWAMH